MKTMHRTELIAELARSLGGDAGLAQIAIDSLFGSLGQAGAGIIPLALKRGGSVVITGFGTFGTKSYSERVMPNPHGGEPLDVPSGRRPVFHPGDVLREMVKPAVQLWPVHR